MLTRECYSFSNGDWGIRQGMIVGTGTVYAGSAWDEIKHIRQAIGFLKPKKALDEITHDLCPISFSSHILSRKSLIQY
ncbi:putative Dilute domain-containing protein [Helianthus anomalus]